MRYLLDTNICIALIKGVRGIREKIISIGIENDQLDSLRGGDF